MSKEFFALDIGTRKVMGIVARRNEDAIEIIGAEIIEHATRPMFDGQIHSIDEVTKVVKLIKATLESRCSTKLSSVGVAVAGRNLLTYQSKVNKAFDYEQEISAPMIRDLELEAIEKIISDSQKNLTQFYCVGYSPVYYELDGNRISDLLGHRGKSIATEVIVTFLPRVVLDSMLTVLDKSGLEATNITLEPISAINAIIPQEMRNINIILVDVGAGTSDLALTKDGFVYAYGMVAEAGDEITERISEILLVDFSTAEKIKRLLLTRKEINYEDIWGRPRSVVSIHLQEKLQDRVAKLAKSIAREGLKLNGGIPHAVVAVGGGSLTPNLIEELSAGFGLSQDKVGIRLPGVIKGIKDTTGKLSGPEAVTPLGILLMTMHSLGLRFINIMVNGKKVRILDFLQKKDIVGALTLSGALNNKKLYARLGLALTAEVNGELKVVRGSLGRPANITLNGRAITSLSEKVEDNDVIIFEEALDGKDASALVRDLLQSEPIRIVFNQEPIEVAPLVIMNGVQVSDDTPLLDLAKIETHPLKVIDILKFKGVNIESLSERQILVNINKTPRILTQRNFTLLLNDVISDLNAAAKSGDIIEFHIDAPTCYRIKDLIDLPEDFTTMRVNVDGQDIEILIEPVRILMNGHSVSPQEFIIDGAEIEVYYVKRQILLSEIFKYIEFDPYKGIGKNIKIFVNDKPAGFTTPLAEGSRVQIVFQEREH